MKLIFALLLSLLLAYYECMELSSATQNSIRNILHDPNNLNTREVGEAESFLVDLEGLCNTFRYVNDEGSIKLAETFVQAYNKDELTREEISKFMNEAAGSEKNNAYDYFARNIKNYERIALLIAAMHGNLHMFQREYPRYEYVFNFRVEVLNKCLIPAIRAGHIHIIRWVTEKRLIRFQDIEEFLLAALDSKNQEMINYLFDAPIYYFEFKNPRIPLTYDQCFQWKDIFCRLDVAYKAIAIGNQKIVRYFLDKNVSSDFINFEHAYKIAVSSGHSQILELIIDYLIKNIQLRAEKNSFKDFVARQMFIFALEKDIKRVIKFLLDENIYPDPLNINNRLNLENRLKACPFFGQKYFFIKAAEYGNLDVVNYFWKRKLLTNHDNLIAAQKAASDNGHADIANLIDAWLKSENK